jgi:DNA-binding SARP family transcriptional activator/tetratricopeptide (TPR) repeat protein
VLRFGLFGGVRVQRDGIEVPITQRKQREILALLLAAPNEQVAVSEIIDALWPDEPAASALNQIHRHIGSLRRICEPGLPRRNVGRHIVPSGGGYRIAVDAESSDVLRFRALVRQADQGAGGDRHGVFRAYVPALDVASAPADCDSLRAHPSFVGLEDERIRAVVAAAEMCETPDEHAAVLPALRAASARHRLDETLQAQVITALCRTGRASDALAVYRAVRAALKKELGTPPGAAIEAAHALVRHPDQARRIDLAPSVGAPPGPAVRPMQLPSPLPGFAGRRAALGALRNPAGHGKRLLITGMAGVGKTALALRHAADMAEHYPDGQLYVNLRGFDASAAPLDPLDALQDLLHGLGIPPRNFPESLGARSGLFRSVLADRRILLALDNARDYRQVEPLLPGDGRNLVIITSRNRLPGLVTFEQFRPVELEPFDDEEVVEFFQRRLPAARVRDHREPLTRLGNACGGLPLALAIVVARAEANPRFPLDLFVREVTSGAGLAALTVGSPEVDLSTVFSWSCRGLSEDAARAFAVLSAHPGPEISTAAAISMSGLDTRRAHLALDELAQANILRATSPGHHTFHDLVREYGLDLLGDGLADASRRLICHYVRSTANALTGFEQPPAATPLGDLPGVIAEQFRSSAEAINWYAEHRHVLRAVCRRAFDLGDYRSALLLMLNWRPLSQAIDARRDMLPFADLAIEAAEQVDDVVLQAEAYRDAASNYARTDQPERARTYFENAAAAYRRSGDQQGLSGVYRSMGVTLSMDPDDRIALLLESVAIISDLDGQPNLAIARHSLGLGYLWAGRYDNALREFEQAHAVAVAAGQLTHLEPHLLSARSRTLARTGRLDEAAEAATQALAIFRRHGAAYAELRLLHSHGEVLTTLGRRAEAAQAWRRYLALATDPGLIRETTALDDDTDAQATIDRIEKQLAALSE